MDLGKEGRVLLFLTILFFKFTVISSPLPMIVWNVHSRAMVLMPLFKPLFSHHAAKNLPYSRSNLILV